MPAATHPWCRRPCSISCSTLGRIGSHRYGAIGSAVFSAGSCPVHPEDIWCSIETLPWFLYALCCPFAISSLGTAAMLLCSISGRPGSGAADRQVVPLCNPQYADIAGSPRPSRSIVSASVEVGASRYQSG